MRNQIFLVIMKKRVKVLCKTDTSPTYPISRYVKKKVKTAYRTVGYVLLYFCDHTPNTLTVCMYVCIKEY